MPLSTVLSTSALLHPKLNVAGEFCCLRKNCRIKVARSAKFALSHFQVPKAFRDVRVWLGYQDQLDPRV